MRQARELSDEGEERTQAETENKGTAGADLFSFYLEELK